MAHRLVGDVVAHTGHAAPYGLPPAAYLGAVLAERQRREWARTVGAQQYVPEQPRQQAPQAPQAPQPPVPPAATSGGFAPPA